MASATLPVRSGNTIEIDHRSRLRSATLRDMRPIAWAVSNTPMSCDAIGSAGGTRATPGEARIRPMRPRRETPLRRLPTAIALVFASLKRSRVICTLLGAVLFGSALGCLGEEPAGPPVALCRSSSWKTIFEASYLAEGMSGGLAYADHTIYFSAKDANGAFQIWALADTDGAIPVAIAPGFAFHPIIENDHLSFVDSAGISELPLPGGAPQTTLTLPEGARRGPLLVAPHDVYWNESTPDDGIHDIYTLIKKMSRPEGVVTDFATLPTKVDVLSSVPLLALSDTALLAAGDGGKAFAIPFDGTPIRPFPLTTGDERLAVSNLLGLDATGGTWIGELQEGPGDVRVALKFGPADGSPTTDFWSPEPPTNFGRVKPGC